MGIRYTTHISMLAKAINKYHGTVDKHSVFEIFTGFSKVMLINEKSLKKCLLIFADKSH